MESQQLGHKVLERIKLEEQQYIPQKAQACIISKTENENIKALWLMPSTLKQNHSIKANILGNFVGVVPTHSTYLNINGEPCVSKNSPLGNAISESGFELGSLNYNVNGKSQTLDIIANAKYKVKSNKNDAFEGAIQSINNDGFEFVDSLIDALKDEEKLIQLKLQSNELSEIQRIELVEKLNSIKKEIEDKLTISQKRRRTTNSIRQQFLLDPEQNIIKRTKLLNGPLVINGGPGTGKTTLLIHRIQYMLDSEIENDELLSIRLNNDDKSFIRNQETGWIFYSPTELLKKYLQNAMSAEGLEAHDNTVRTWEQQKTSIKKSLGLFDTVTNRPFQMTEIDSPLWNLSASQILNVQTAFENFYNSFFQNAILKLDSVSSNKTPWAKDIDTIKSYFFSLKQNFKLESFILGLNECYNLFADLRISIDKEYKLLIDNISTNVQSKLSIDEKDFLIALLKERKSKKDIDEDETDDNNEFPDEIIDGKKIEQDLNRLIKKAIRNEALSEIDKNTRISKVDKLVLDKISGIINKDNYELIAYHSLFIKYFKPLLNGADNFILSRFWRIYKVFRRDILSNAEWLSMETRQSFTEIINATPKNVRLHQDEIDLLIFLSMRMARLFYNASPEIFNNSTHAILVSFKIHVKGLVAVDEATDFTPIQLASMYLLSRPRLNSITLSGDLMQQMNTRGLTSWDDLKLILPGVEIKSLVKSYRQTPKLLKLASTLYSNRFGVEPGFFSSQNDDDNDPDPLFIIEGNWDKKINWVSNRIADLYSIYENLIPNIAIFVKNDEDIKMVTDKLNDTAMFKQHAIKAKACIGEGEIGSVEFVRVFNINLIKGMEFEAVFFLDIDEYASDKSDIIDKLIYVGVSRATYYLALTFNNCIPDSLLSIIDLLISDGTWSSHNADDY